MRKIYATLVLCILTLSLFSQQDTLLKNFKYRINTYRAINYNISGGSQFQSIRLGSDTSKSGTAYGNLGAVYFATKSTDRILLTTSASLSSSFGSNKSDRPNELNKTKGFVVVPGFSLLNKWFTKNYFTELGASVSAYYQTQKSTGPNLPYYSKYTRAATDIAINTGIGKGRLENITDMQNALWLYKDLQDEKILSRPLTGDELNELGKAITLGNNTRVLDVRKRTQFILKTVDNYFQQKGILNKTDINYFVHLNDILFFAFNNPRLSGTEKFIRFTPSLSFNNQDQTFNNLINKTESRYNSKSLTISTGIEKHVPVNLTHQNNYGAAFKFEYRYKDETEKHSTSGAITNSTALNTTIKEAEVNAFFEHVIYRNTRTNINFNLQAATGYQDINHQSGFYGVANLSALVNYFISYRTRLTCSAGAVWQKNNYYNSRTFEPNSKIVQLYANAGLVISL